MKINIFDLRQLRNVGYYKLDAGPHMVCEPETRAVLDWVIANRNVAGILTFGESDNLIIGPNTSGRLGPAREIDLMRFAEAGIAEAGRVGMIQTAPAGFGRLGGGGFEMSDIMAFLEMGGGGRAQTFPTQQAQQTQAATGRPRMPERRPATTVNTADIDYFKAVSDKYTEMTGIRQPLVVREPQGAFFQYGYYQFGVASFSTPGWGLKSAETPGRRTGMMPGGAPTTQPPAAGTQTGGAAGGQAALAQMMQLDRQSLGREFQRLMGGAPAAGTDQAGQTAEPGIDKQLLQWMDSEKIDGFIPWTKFNHQELGEVEIGGFKPYAVINPPAAKITELGASHAKFALHLSSLFPKVKIVRTEVTNHGGGLFRVKAAVENVGFLPTALAHSVASRSVKPTMVQLGLDQANIISGHSKTNFFQALAGSGNSEKFEWLIKGKAGDKIELKVVSQKAGSDKTIIVLK